jgi:pyruvate-formate lyase
MAGVMLRVAFPREKALYPEPTADLPALERQLDAQLIAFEKLDTAWPKAPTALERARIGREREKALLAIRELRGKIAHTPAHNLADAAVLLRRLFVTLETEDDGRARLVEP